MRSRKQAAAKLEVSAAAARWQASRWRTLRLSNCVWVAQSSRSTLPCVVGDAGVRACTTAFHRRPRWQAHGGSISANEVPDYLARKIRDDCPDEPPRYGAATPSGCRPDPKCHCHRSGFYGARSRPRFRRDAEARAAGSRGRCQPRSPTLEPGRVTRPSPYARFRAVGSSEEGEGEGSLTRSGCASISV
jgi:hypothetical protein